MHEWNLYCTKYMLLQDWLVRWCLRCWYVENFYSQKRLNNNTFFTDCAETYCNSKGTCSIANNCTCNPLYSEATNCHTCAENRYQYPECKCMSYLPFNFLLNNNFELDCLASFTCNGHGTCNTLNGQCSCFPEFSNSNCSTCAPNHYNYPNCTCKY